MPQAPRSSDQCATAQDGTWCYPQAGGVVRSAEVLSTPESIERAEECVRGSRLAAPEVVRALSAPDAVRPCRGFG